MRFLYLYSAYPLYLQKLYSRRPGLDREPYEKQRAEIRDDAFGWADFWSHYLSQEGMDADECLVNAKAAQSAWASERGVAVPGDWLRGIAAARVAAFAPEVLFIDDFSIFPEAWVRELRQRVRSIKLIIAWCGAPYRDESFFRACDLVLSCIPELVQHFRERGHRSELLRHGFDRRILGRMRGVAEVAPVQTSFIGNVSAGDSAHGERARLLAYLADRCELAVFTPAADRTLLQRARAIAKAAAGLGAEGLLPRELRKRMRPSVFGLEMFRTLRASRVTLNSHIAISKNSASNMRLYEATGAGTCLLTDWKPDLGRQFDLDREVVTYRGAEECAEKVTYLLAHPEVRDRIAEAGQARTLRDHGFEIRAQEMHAILRSHLR